MSNYSLKILPDNPGNQPNCYIPLFVNVFHDKGRFILLSHCLAVIAGVGNNSQRKIRLSRPTISVGVNSFPPSYIVHQELELRFFQIQLKNILFLEVQLGKPHG